MKRSLLFIFTLLTITLSAVAQPRISSNKETHHFGQIDAELPQKGIGIHPLDFVFFTHHAGFQHDFARHGRSSGTRRKGPHGT